MTESTTPRMTPNEIVAELRAEGGSGRGAYQFMVQAADLIEEQIRGISDGSNAIAALECEIHSRADLIRRYHDIIGYNNDDGFHIDPDPETILRRLVAEASYAEECRRLLQEAREIVHVFNPFTPLKKRIDNALAKNPNPAGSVRTEPSPASSGTLDVGCTSEDSGPVGLGPHAMRSHAVGLPNEATCPFCHSNFPLPMTSLSQGRADGEPTT